MSNELATILVIVNAEIGQASQTLDLGEASSIELGYLCTKRGVSRGRLAVRWLT